MICHVLFLFSTDSINSAVTYRENCVLPFKKACGAEGLVTRQTWRMMVSQVNFEQNVLVRDFKKEKGFYLNHNLLLITFIFTSVYKK